MFLNSKLLKYFLIMIGSIGLFLIGYLKGIKENKNFYEKTEFEVIQIEPIKFDKRFDLLKSEGAKYGIWFCGKRLSAYIDDPFSFLIALICVESNFGRFKKGKHGEIGIMQIHPYWVNEKKLVKKFFEDDFLNVCVGTEILEDLFKQFKDPFLVLRVWNTGKLYRGDRFIDRFLECKGIVDGRNPK